MKLRIRNPKDFCTGAIYLGVGLAAIVIGRDYGMGTATKMGAAYFPMVLAGLLALIGSIAMVRAFVYPGEAIGTIAWKKVILIVGSTLLFGLLLRGAGVVIALTVMVLLSAYASPRFRWGPAALLAGGLVVFSVTVFIKALGVPLPVFGSWFGA